MIKVKIKKLDERAVLPRYFHDGDAGQDVVCVSRRESDKFVEYGTGLAFEIPKGYALFAFPRSSVSKYDLNMANSVGVIDSNYRGELFVRFRKNGEDIYEVGDKIAQIIVLPYPEVEFEEVSELEKSVRGEGAFGSTGK